MQHRTRIYQTPTSVIEMILAAENEALRRRLAQVEAELAAAQAVNRRGQDA